MEKTNRFRLDMPVLPVLGLLSLASVMAGAMAHSP